MQAIVGTNFREQLRELAENASRKAMEKSAPILACLSTAITPFDNLHLFESVQASTRWFWEQPAENFSLLGIGEAVNLSSHNQAGVADAEVAWRKLIADAIVYDAKSSPLSTPLCLGGFAFDFQRTADPDWRDFASAYLFVPKLLVASVNGSARLIVSVVVEPDSPTDAIARTVAEETELLFKVDAPLGRLEEQVELRIEQSDDEAEGWKEGVNSIVKSIRRGDIEKVVLARRLNVRADKPLSISKSLGRLRSRYAACTIFAFARGERCFLGATPERLVKLHDGKVEVACLAGSAPRGDSKDEDCWLGATLLADPKELQEHQLVVNTVQDDLRPLCSRLDVSQSPTLLKMPNIQHLYTPIEGVPNVDTTIFDFVERLHPTPASGGVPRRAAFGLIRSYEPFDRGWYAGPIGWIDRSGGGEFAVAIRSALLRGREATLYAGCGIVADSDAEREYEESELKLQSMLWALNATTT